LLKAWQQQARCEAIHKLTLPRQSFRRARCSAALAEHRALEEAARFFCLPANFSLPSLVHSNHRRRIIVVANATGGENIHRRCRSTSTINTAALVALSNSSLFSSTIAQPTVGHQVLARAIALQLMRRLTTGNYHNKQ
jgi:hypothetical protein